MGPSRSLVLGMVVLLAGCYHYVPVSSGEVAPGTEVRARISDAYAAEVPLEEVLGSRSRALTGTVLSSERDTLRLLVSVASVDGLDPRVTRLNQRLAFPRPAVLELEARRLDRARTGLLAGAGGAVVLFVLWTQLTGWYGGDTLPPEPPKEFRGCCAFPP